MVSRENRVGGKDANRAICEKLAPLKRFCHPHPNPLPEGERDLLTSFHKLKKHSPSPSLSPSGRGIGVFPICVG